MYKHLCGIKEMIEMAHLANFHALKWLKWLRDLILLKKTSEFRDWEMLQLCKENEKSWFWSCDLSLHFKLLGRIYML